MRAQVFDPRGQRRGRRNVNRRGVVNVVNDNVAALREDRRRRGVRGKERARGVERALQSRRGVAAAAAAALRRRRRRRRRHHPKPSLRVVVVSRPDDARRGRDVLRRRRRRAQIRVSADVSFDNADVSLRGPLVFVFLRAAAVALRGAAAVPERLPPRLLLGQRRRRSVALALARAQTQPGLGIRNLRGAARSRFALALPRGRRTRLRVVPYKRTSGWSSKAS
eukprot:23725-Pelagococcus_subviridis.AAC.2